MDERMIDFAATGNRSLPNARVFDNPLTNVTLGQDPLVTDLVLGMPTPKDFPSNRIWPRKKAPAPTFKYTVFSDNSGLKRYDTKRPMRADIKFIDLQVGTATASLDRYSIGVLRDKAELANANANLPLRQLCTHLARAAVQNNIERDVRDAILNTASYPAANVITLASGSEWNAALGDSRTDVRAVAHQISQNTGCSWQDIEVWLPQSAFEAVLADPVFLAATIYQAGGTTPNLEAIAKFWGVGSVWTSNPFDATDAGVIAPMYSDTAVVYYTGGDLPDLDTSFGKRVFGRQYTWNDGFALMPWYIDGRTSWAFPWEDWNAPLLLTAGAGGLILNTNADV